MSIWATSIDFDSDDHEDCAKWVPCDCDDAHAHGAVEVFLDGRHSRFDDHASCTCKAGPIAYRTSNIFPSEDDTRHGRVDLAEIPSHITPDGRDTGQEDGDPHPWLRCSVNDQTVILDRDQVEQVAEYLDSWLWRTKP